MKISLQITILTLILVGCSSLIETEKSSNLDDNTDSHYFEGEMRFSILYDSVPSHLTNDYLNHAIGSEMVIIFKNGNHRKDYFSPDGKLISQRYLNLTEQKSFSISSGEDTVLWFNINIPDTRATFTKLSDTLFRGYKCTPIASQVFTPNPQNKDQDLELNRTYYSARELRSNPDWFTNYQEGNYNEMIKMTESIVIATYEKGPFWNTTILCDTVIWRNVKDSELSIEKIKNRPLKEL